MNIAMCSECGLPLVESPSGFATCPGMHGRLLDGSTLYRSVWIRRLLAHNVDMRTLPVAVWKRRKYFINGKRYRPAKYTPLMYGKIFALTPNRRHSPIGVFKLA
jgi:hypothetical protein